MKYGNKIRFNNVSVYPNFHLDSEIVVEGEKSCLSIGNNLFVRRGFSIRLADGNLEIGKDVFFNSFCSVACLGKIIIGDYTMFGENVKLYDHNHNYKDDSIPFMAQGWTVGEIVVGENCWIGSNVVILKDVHIGKNCIIGAGCTVYKNVPDDMILLSNGAMKSR